jgi:hypothetical protein
MTEINILALAIVAMSLRSGIPCKVPALAALQANDPKAMDLIMSQIGGQNCHVGTVFEDGLISLARFRLIIEPSLPPLQITNYVLSSEIATMTDLARTNIRVPKVFYYASEETTTTTPWDLSSS